MRKLIKVTESHIATGLRGRCMDCPIANAINDTGRAYGSTKVRSTHVDLIHAEGPSGSRHVKLPRSARRFIARFDNGEPVKPFNFFLEMPC